MSLKLIWKNRSKMKEKRKSLNSILLLLKRHKMWLMISLTNQFMNSKTTFGKRLMHHSVKRWRKYLLRVRIYLIKDLQPVELKRLTSAEGSRKISDNTARSWRRSYSKMSIRIYLGNSTRPSKKIMGKSVIGLGMKKHRFMISGKSARTVSRSYFLSLNILRLTIVALIML